MGGGSRDADGVSKAGERENWEDDDSDRGGINIDVVDEDENEEDDDDEDEDVMMHLTPFLENRGSLKRYRACSEQLRQLYGRYG